MTRTTNARPRAAILLCGPVFLAWIGGGPLRGAAEEKVPAAADKVAPAEAVAENAQPDPDEVQRQQQIKQQTAHWEQQFTKLLYGDLELIRSICPDLPPEKRRAISTAGDRAVKEAASRLTELQMGARIRRRANDPNRRDVGKGKNPAGRDGEAGGGAGGDKLADNPLAIVSAALERSLQEQVGDTQAEAFAAEIAARHQRRRSAVIGELVAALDAELFLTESQRTAIGRSLEAGWTDLMLRGLQTTHSINGRRVFPGLPGDGVLPHLTDVQRQRIAIQEKPANQAEMVAWRQQAWMQELNQFNSLQAAKRDAWWFP